MSEFSSLALWGYVVAAAMHGLFAAYLGLSWREGRPGGALILAVVGSALWATGSCVQVLYPSAWTADIAAVLDVLRMAAWFGFLLVLLEPISGSGLARLVRFAVLVVAFSLAMVGLNSFGGTFDTSFLSAALGGFLANTVFGLVLVEQLYRRIPTDSRWGLKPLCLGLLAGYIFDLYYFADGFLFGRLDPDIWGVRGIVFALTLPLVAVTAARSPSWTLKIAVSREVVFHSTALAVSGVYLLLIAGAGYYVRYFGGSWGRALQLALLFGGGLLFGVLFFSGTQRAKLRVLINKHLFPYRYDYRVEWQRFTNALSTVDGSLDLGQSVIRALADQVESSGGLLWLTDESGDFRMQARLNHPASEIVETRDGALCQFLEEHEWVINLEEYRSRPSHYQDLRIPPWLSELQDGWLVVPLKSSGALIGFVVLNSPRTPFEIDWEVLDLLKSSQRQAASYLAQMMATEALLDARKFESFNRMSAFVVHDLKNLVAQLSLMLKNAQRHRNNPEFQEDMLSTVTHVEDRMRALMNQLQEKTSINPRKPVEIGAMLEHIVLSKRHHRQSISLCKQTDTAFFVNGHPERLERVVGHVVQNALDACDDNGKVVIWLAPESENTISIVVEDTGKGMSEVFMRDYLFKPFQSSKSSGMGIGVYETQQYLKELGGAIQYESEEGRGTRARIVLPLLKGGDADRGKLM